MSGWGGYIANDGCRTSIGTATASTVRLLVRLRFNLSITFGCLFVLPAHLSEEGVHKVPPNNALREVGRGGYALLSHRIRRVQKFSVDEHVVERSLWHWVRWSMRSGSDNETLRQ